jgi:NADPH-dependent 2,4-dienoyl-CoA reductase/sulfur reductase-like enzyme
MDDLVVIGGAAAEMTAASRARRQPDWQITVFERGDHVSFILCHRAVRG